MGRHPAEPPTRSPAPARGVGRRPGVEIPLKGTRLPLKGTMPRLGAPAAPAKFPSGTGDGQVRHAARCYRRTSFTVSQQRISRGDSDAGATVRTPPRPFVALRVSAPCGAPRPFSSTRPLAHFAHLVHPLDRCDRRGRPVCLAWTGSVIGVDSAPVHADHTRTPRCATVALFAALAGSDLVRGPRDRAPPGVHALHTIGPRGHRVDAGRNRLKSMIWKCINRLCRRPPPRRAADQ